MTTAKQIAMAMHEFDRRVQRLKRLKAYREKAEHIKRLHEHMETCEPCRKRHELILNGMSVMQAMIAVPPDAEGDEHPTPPSGLR